MKIKICGMCDAENIKELSALKGIDYLGLIFAPSIRQISVDLALKYATIIQERGKKVIGVFVDESDEFILKNASYLDGVQIYKSITLTLYQALKALNKEIWQVIRVAEALILPQDLNADLILFDTKAKVQGGSGLSFDWNLLKDFKQKFGLAGGIGEHNIKEALALKPELLDLNSKLEIKPGLKDKLLVEKILTKVGL